MKPTAESVKNALEIITEKLESLMVTKDCYVCGKTFQVPAGPYAQYQKKCQPCSDAQDAASKKAIEERDAEKKLREWHELCPKGYRSVDRSKLPNPKKLDEVLEWQFGPKGLVLFGETGRGKTRCAWELLRIQFASGKSVAVMDAMAGLIYGSKFSDSVNEAKLWIEEMINVNILLLDDVFKVKLTDSFEGAVFALIDSRIQWERPTILTSNDTGATLVSRMSQDRANPLLRRLREHCIQINF